MESIKINAELKSRTEQATILTLALREALSILEMPLPALAEWLQEQIEQNPALQFEEEPGDWEKERSNNFHTLSHAETSWIDQIAAPGETLYTYLLQQAREVLSSPDDLKEMEELIGNLDEKGFLGDTPADPKLLNILYTLDPPGIGAKNLQHSLLLQLERKGEKESLAYRLIHDHYDDFINRRKNLPCSPKELEAVVDTLSHLSLDPAAPFRQLSLPLQTPDVFIESHENGWGISHNDALLPKFTLNLAPELSHFEPSAKWTLKMLTRRGQIITAIVKIVLEVQNDFFLGKTSDLHTLTFKQVAEKLSLHESTISRAVKEKVLSSPRGIYPLRFFFPHASSAFISHHTAKERLKNLIEHESKHKPLSDQELSKLLHAQGIPCARRTIAKYRKSLKVPVASQRKQRIS
ncbi:MAG: RNA polymerase factor sigma-54 [Rhabdochlamydiaceae bacterium]|nr:RNA polymerase factor sigma-54 [Rhabdochlamydiaceae bacterium]